MFVLNGIVRWWSYYGKMHGRYLILYEYRTRERAKCLLSKHRDRSSILSSNVNPNTMSCVCNPSAEEVQTGTQPILMGNSQVSVSNYVSKGKMGGS